MTDDPIEVAPPGPTTFTLPSVHIEDEFTYQVRPFNRPEYDGPHTCSPRRTWPTYWEAHNEGCRAAAALMTLHPQVDKVEVTVDKRTIVGRVS